jgi:hypothetical protein
MSDAGASGGFDTGRSLKLAMTIMAHDPPKFILFALIFAGAPDAAMTYVTSHYSELGLADLGFWVTMVATVLVSLLGATALQAVIAHGVLSKFNGDQPNRDDTRFGWVGQMLRLTALCLVTTLGIMGGFILLIIPGVILSMAWFVVVPAMVTERLGVMPSIKRSNHLTGNARGAIFGLCFVIGLAGVVLGWLTQLLISAVGDPVFAVIAGPVLQAATGLASAVVAVAVYHQLRQSQEGTPVDRLAAVFD